LAVAGEKIEVADPIDHLVVDRVSAVAEANFCTQVKINLAAAIGGLAAESQARSPQVAGERPFSLSPDRAVARAASLRLRRLCTEKGGIAANRCRNRNGGGDGECARLRHHGVFSVSAACNAA